MVKLTTPDAVEQLCGAVERLRAVLDEQFLKCGDCHELMAADDVGAHVCGAVATAAPRAEMCVPCEGGTKATWCRVRTPCKRPRTASMEAAPEAPGANAVAATAATAAVAVPTAAAVPTVAAVAAPAVAAAPSAAPAAKPEVAPRRRAWSAREDAAICELVAAHGQDFATVAAALPGRTADGVRNRWGRLRGGGKLPSSLQGNRYKCVRCGMLKRGHTCPGAPADGAKPPPERARRAAPRPLPPPPLPPPGMEDEFGGGDSPVGHAPALGRAPSAEVYLECLLLDGGELEAAALPPLKDLPKEFALKAESGDALACGGGADDLIGDVDLHELEAILWGDATTCRCDRWQSRSYIRLRIHMESSHPRSVCVHGVRNLTGVCCGRHRSLGDRVHRRRRAPIIAQLGAQPPRRRRGRPPRLRRGPPAPSAASWRPQIGGGGASSGPRTGRGGRARRRGRRAQRRRR